MLSWSIIAICLHCAAAPPPGGADHDLVETVHDSVDPAETEHNSSETAHAPSETGDATPVDPSKIPPPHEEDEGVHRVFTENYAATQPVCHIVTLISVNTDTHRYRSISAN